MNSVFDRVAFTRGPGLKNCFILAPLTNLQSHVDGTLSDDEYHWLTLRARSGFSATMSSPRFISTRPAPLGLP